MGKKAFIINLGLDNYLYREAQTRTVQVQIVNRVRSLLFEADEN